MAFLLHHPQCQTFTTFKSQSYLLKGLFFLLFFLGVSLCVHAEDAPLSMLNHVASQMEAVLKENQADLQKDPSIVHQAVEKYLIPHVDLVGMSRSVLGRKVWTEASEKDRIAFSQAFKDLVIRTYGASLAKYQGETIQFYPIRGGVTGRFVRVESQIKRNGGPPIALNYSLVSKNGQWKIYDLTVEGVSLLQSYHSQFEEALHRQTLTELTAKMQHTGQAT